MTLSELVAMIKSDEEDGAAEPDLVVVPLNALFATGSNITDTWEQTPPRTPLNGSIADSIRLDIPYEPSTNMRFLIKGRATRMSKHGTSWLLTRKGWRGAQSYA